MARPPDELTRRYKQLIARYGDRTAAKLVYSWDQLGAYSTDDIARYAKQTAPAVQGAKTAATAASVAFFAHSHRIRPPAVNPDDIDLQPRIDGPFHAMWHAVSQGRPTDEAIIVGASVASGVALDFVTSIARRASDHAAKAAGIRVRWARVPDANGCDWCQLVAEQTYTSAETADFGHDRCSCAVVSD